MPASGSHHSELEERGSTPFNLILLACVGFFALISDVVSIEMIYRRY
jgi:hypothetical protein